MANQYTPGIQEKYNKAIEEYINSKESLTKICKIYHTDRAILSKKLKERGYEVINQQNLVKLNENFFDTIDNEHKAYWLGFMYADGNISSHKPNYKKQYEIEISLKSSDIHHLEKFCIDLDFRKKLYKDDIRCRVTFRNKHMWETLNKQGCFPNKSLILQFPTIEQVPEQWQPAFVRGYIDGDGSVMINTLGTAPRLSVLGTKEFLVTMRKVMGWKENKIQHPSNAYSVEWSGKYVEQYLDQLYANADIYLDRKYEKYLYIKNVLLPSK